MKVYIQWKAPEDYFLVTGSRLQNHLLSACPLDGTHWFTGAFVSPTALAFLAKSDETTRTLPPQAGKGK